MEMMATVALITSIFDILKVKVFQSIKVLNFNKDGNGSTDYFNLCLPENFQSIKVLNFNKDGNGSTDYFNL